MSAYASCRWLRQTLADLQLALMLGLGGQLLGHALGLPGAGLLAVVASRVRPPKPSASGCILTDGTYEMRLGEDFVIRHKPVDHGPLVPREQHQALVQR